MPEWFNHPDFMDRAGDMMEGTEDADGNLKWDVFTAGEHDQPGTLNFSSLSINPRGDKDEAAYERSREAAVHFLNFFVSREHQRDTNVDFGLFPVRDDVREEAIELNPGEENHQQLQTGFQLMDMMDHGWPQHPQHIAIRHEITPPHIQDMLNEEIEPEEAMDRAARDINEAIEGTRWAE